MSPNLTPREMKVTPREMKACEAMQPLGLDASLVLRKYRSLSKLYGKNATQMIEEENYRALADACFDEMEKPGKRDGSEESEDEDMPPRKLRRRSESNASRNSQESRRVEARAQHEEQARALARAQQAQAEAEVRARARAQAEVQAEGRKPAPAQLLRRTESRGAQTQTSTESWTAQSQHQQPRTSVSRGAQTQEQSEAGHSNGDTAHTERLPQVKVKFEVRAGESAENGQARAASFARTSEIGVDETVQYNGALEKRKGVAVQPQAPLKKPKLETAMAAECQRNRAVPSCASPRTTSAAVSHNGSPAEGKRPLPHTGRPPLSPVQPSPSSDMRRVCPFPSKVPVMRLQETLTAKVKKEPPESATMRSNGVVNGSSSIHAEEGKQGIPPVVDAAVQCVETKVASAAAGSFPCEAGGSQPIEATDPAHEPVELTGPVGAASEPLEVAAEAVDAAAEPNDVAAGQMDAAARDMPLQEVKMEPDTAVQENGGREPGAGEANVAHSNSHGACCMGDPAKNQSQDATTANGASLRKDRKGKAQSVTHSLPQARKANGPNSHMETDQKGKGLLLSNSVPEAITVAQHDEAGTDDGGFHHNVEDISCGYERVPIPCVNESTSECLPSSFQYMSNNTVHQNAYVMFNLERIADDNRCGCMGDCLQNTIPCHCSARTGGVYAYTEDGCLKDHFIDQHLKKVKGEDVPKPLVYCVSKKCPLENEGNHPGKCRGHPVRPFIKECWVKCRCNKELCGNRVVQRGVTRRLQVFWTKEGKGWGIQTLEDLPKGAFLFEYVGEVLTNSELHKRNDRSTNDSHHYPVTLDSDWVTEEFLTDNEALCLDGTYFGNVARFLNHRCFDSNMMDMAVEIETADHNYYHIAFFTTRFVKANEELTWDYGIDFEDLEHPVKAFICKCGSPYCRDPNNRAARSSAESS